MSIDHTAPARAEHEERLAEAARIYLKQIEARCVGLSEDSLRVIERAKMEDETKGYRKKGFGK